ncbi:MAG: response regulator [bacterium]
MYSEKREYPRAELKKAKARYKVPNQLEIGLATIKNISGGGVCLLTDREIPAGATVVLEFALPGDTTSIVAEAEVVWRDEMSAPTEHKYQMGMKFVKIDAGKKSEITSFVVRYLRSKVSKEIEPEKKHERRKHSILAVDDDKVTLKVIRDIFRDEFEVFTASDGHAGVEMAREKRPDLILLDIVMPDFDGFSALTLLKDFPETKDIPVIMLSVIREKSKIFHALREGAKDYILKPFTTENLVARIRSIIYGN